MRDDFSLGPCIGLGAMFITGINNNPLTLLARQIGLSLRHTNEDCCELINEEGWRPDPSLDKRVEAHFNKALDKLSEWRKSPQGTTDVALGGKQSKLVLVWFGQCFSPDKLVELHQQILAEEGGEAGYSGVGAEEGEAGVGAEAGCSEVRGEEGQEAGYSEVRPAKCCISPTHYLVYRWRIGYWTFTSAIWSLHVVPRWTD